jgi:hypothetical protein
MTERARVLSVKELAGGCDFELIVQSPEVCGPEPLPPPPPSLPPIPVAPSNNYCNEKSLSSGTWAGDWFTVNGNKLYWRVDFLKVSCLEFLRAHAGWYALLL